MQRRSAATQLAAAVHHIVGEWARRASAAWSSWRMAAAQVHITSHNVIYWIPSRQVYPHRSQAGRRAGRAPTGGQAQRAGGEGGGEHGEEGGQERGAQDLGGVALHGEALLVDAEPKAHDHDSQKVHQHVAGSQRTHALRQSVRQPVGWSACQSAG